VDCCLRDIFPCSLMVLAIGHRLRLNYEFYMLAKFCPGSRSDVSSVAEGYLYYIGFDS